MDAKRLPRFVVGAAMCLAAVVSHADPPSSNFWEPTAGPYGGSARSLARTTDSSLFVLGHSLYRSASEGALWEALPASASWYALQAGLSNDLYGLSNTGLDHSSDGGVTWTHLAGSPARPNFVRFAASGRIFVGTTNGLYRSDDNGVSWVPSGIPNGQVTHWIETPAHVLYASRARDLLRSVDDGTTWTVVANLPAWITALGNRPAGGVFLGTQFTFGSGYTGLWVFDGSLSMFPVAFLNDGVQALFTRSDGRLFAATVSYDYLYNALGYLYESVDGGASWAFATSTGELSGIAEGNELDLFLASAGQSWEFGVFPGYVMRRSATGVVTPVGPGMRGDWSFALAIGGGIVYASPGIQWSDNGGLTWNSGNLPSWGWGFGLAVHPSGDVFAKMTSTTRSRDRGQTWTEMPFETWSEARSITITALGSVLVPAAERGVARSADRGDTWSVCVEGAPMAPFLKLEAGPVGRVFASTLGETYLSDDDGQTWKEIASVGAHEMVCDATETTLIGWAPYQVRRFTEGAESWSVEPIASFSVPVHDFIRDASGAVYATADAVYRMRPDETQWTRLESLPGTYPSDPYGITGYDQPMAFDENGFLYVGWIDGVWRSRWPIGTATDVASIAPITIDVPWPNPARDRVAFGVRLPHPTDVSLRIFDVRGRIIATLAADRLLAGSHQLEWTPASQVPNGVYLYRLSTPTTTRTGRLTLVR